jgi:hypothetical protein
MWFLDTKGIDHFIFYLSWLAYLMLKVSLLPSACYYGLVYSLGRFAWSMPSRLSFHIEQKWIHKPPCFFFFDQTQKRMGQKTLTICSRKK